MSQTLQTSLNAEFNAQKVMSLMLNMHEEFQKNGAKVAELMLRMSRRINNKKFKDKLT